MNSRIGTKEGRHDRIVAFIGFSAVVKWYLSLSPARSSFAPIIPLLQGSWYGTQLRWVVCCGTVPHYPPQGHWYVPFYVLLS